MRVAVARLPVVSAHRRTVPAADRKHLRMLSTDLDEALTRLRTEATVSHKGPDDTDEALLRLAADKLRRSAPLGDADLSATVANVLTAVAALLEQHPPLAEPRIGAEVRMKGTALSMFICAVNWPYRTVSLNFRGDPPSLIRRRHSFAQFHSLFEAVG